MEYSRRDHTSRASARDRRFGQTDITGRGSFMSDAPMSLVSLPLNMRGTPSRAIPVHGNFDFSSSLRLLTEMSIC